MPWQQHRAFVSCLCQFPVFTLGTSFANFKNGLILEVNPLNEVSERTWSLKVKVDQLAQIGLAERSQESSGEYMAEEVEQDACKGILSRVIYGEQGNYCN